MLCDVISLCECFFTCIYFKCNLNLKLALSEPIAYILKTVHGFEAKTII